jgi:gamma-glutamylcyclotransferase (GGCT)/AIG2-like uncharacterized protein YtfP
MKLFVYGTLRRAQSAHGLLRGARLIAHARTGPHFTLVDMGDYPALVEAGTTCVSGEIYEVDEALLAELDAYEDAPALYERVVRRIDGHDVWMYLLPERHALGRPRLSSGDWGEKPS